MRARFQKASAKRILTMEPVNSNLHATATTPRRMHASSSPTVAARAIKTTSTLRRNVRAFAQVRKRRWKCKDYHINESQAFMRLKLSITTSPLLSFRAFNENSSSQNFCRIPDKAIHPLQSMWISPFSSIHEGKLYQIANEKEFESNSSLQNVCKYSFLQ